MKTTLNIFIFLIITGLAVHCLLYSQCCGKAENPFRVTENCEPEGDCTGECSPLTQCGDCLTWFIPPVTSLASLNSELNTAPIPFVNGVLLPTVAEIFRPPKA